MQHIKQKLLFICLIFVLLGCFWYFQRVDDNLHIVFCDVGQGNATLLISSKHHVLIDGGPDRKVLECLDKYLPFWFRSLDVIAASHPDKDHIAGLINVFQTHPVQEVVSNGDEKTTVFSETFTRDIAQKSDRYVIAHQGMKWNFDGWSMECIWPPANGPYSISAKNRTKTAESSKNTPITKTDVDITNPYSLAFLVQKGSFRAIIMGDVEIPQEEAIVKSGERVSANVLGIGHHGSRGSSGNQFLKAVSPQVAVISVGKKNSYGHPTLEVIQRLVDIKANILRTDKLGSIEIISNGSAFWKKDPW